VLKDSTIQVVCRACIESPGLIAHYVHIALFHPSTYGQILRSAQNDVSFSFRSFGESDSSLRPSTDSTSSPQTSSGHAQNDVAFFRSLSTTLIYTDEVREGEKEHNSPSLCTHPWRRPTSS